MSSSLPASRKHTVPTHLNLPDMVLTLWSFNLTVRQLLLLLVGGGLAGDGWHELSMLGQFALLGQGVRLVCALVPLLVALLVASYRPAGRYLEVWCLVLLRYELSPRRYVWRSLRTGEPSLLSLVPVVVEGDAPSREDASLGTRASAGTSAATARTYSTRAERLHSSREAPIRRAATAGPYPPLAGKEAS